MLFSCSFIDNVTEDLHSFQKQTNIISTGITTKQITAQGRVFDQLFLRRTRHQRCERRAIPDRPCSLSSCCFRWPSSKNKAKLVHVLKIDHFGKQRPELDFTVHDEKKSNQSSTARTYRSIHGPYAGIFLFLLYRNKRQKEASGYYYLPF